MSFPAIGARMKIVGNYWYLEYGTLRVRWDDENTWHITLHEPPQSEGSTRYSGLCANYDGDPESEYRSSRSL